MTTPGGVGEVVTLDQLEPAPTVVTVGNFDGVHLGHQRLLERTVAAASANSARSVALTFDPHPAAVLRPDVPHQVLTTLDRRLELMAASGVDLVVVVTFDRAVAALPPEAFVEQVLIDAVGAIQVVVGQNFRFGRGAEGDTATLAACGAAHGFALDAVELRAVDGGTVSSSAIRRALRSGDMEFTSRALGRDHEVSATVVHGDGRGRAIGVPTANLAVPEGLALPADGVYAGLAQVGDAVHPCVSNIGVRPTVTDATAHTIEAHLIDADLDLYGRAVTVSFAHRLRGEQRFADRDALVAQINDDIVAARAWLTANRSSEPTSDGVVAR